MINLKREKIAHVIHGVEIYNPTPKQRLELKKQLVEMNGEAIESMGKTINEMIDNGADLTKEEINSVRVSAILEVAKKSSTNQMKWVSMLTNLNTGLLTNDVLDDPSQELRDVFTAMMKYSINPIRKEVQYEFDEQIKTTEDKVVDDMKLGV